MITQPRQPAAPVIIDTDPGVDDALALLLAAASPELEVLAITTVGGNTGLDRVTDNARRVVAVAWEGRPFPPIFRGSGGNADTAEEVHGIDGLGGVSLLRARSGEEHFPPAAPVEDESAFDAIPRLARSRPGEVTLVTLGPLSNVAAALERDPVGMRQLRRIIVMGGAFRESGNITPYAEFNIYVDPEAAQTVCDSGIPILWVPTDVTHRCILRPVDLNPLPPSRREQFLRTILPANFDFHFRCAGEQATFMHDPLALAVAIWPDLVRTRSLRVDIETKGAFTRGMTVADFRGYRFLSPLKPNAEVALAVDAALFMRRYLERMGTP